MERSVDSDGDGSGSAVVTRFTYEDGNAWGDLNTSGSLTSRRIFGQGLDDLIARIGSSGNEDWYLGDIIGSTRDIVDYTGLLIDRLAYDAYGLPTTETNPSNGDRYKFTSREWEAEIELQYNRARYLDPKTMRWISEDPIGFDAGDSNLYRYVRNNPTKWTDPSGLQDPRIEDGGKGFPERREELERQLREKEREERWKKYFHHKENIPLWARRRLLRKWRKQSKIGERDLL